MFKKESAHWAITITSRDDIKPWPIAQNSVSTIFSDITNSQTMHEVLYTVKVEYRSEIWNKTEAKSRSQQILDRHGLNKVPQKDPFIDSNTNQYSHILLVNEAAHHAFEASFSVVMVNVMPDPVTTRMHELGCTSF